MPIKPPLLDRNGYQYSPEVKAKLDAAIRAKAIELSQSYQPNPEPMQSIGYEVETVSEDKKPYQKPGLERLDAADVPEGVKTDFDKALADKQEHIPGFAQGGLVDAPKPQMVGYPKARKAKHWDVRDYTQFFTEIIVFRMNQISHTNTAEHYWAAQNDNVKLRNKLQTAYNSAIQKAQIKHSIKTKKTPSETMTESVIAIEFPEIWMFGAAVYELITEQGMRLSDVLEMSGAKLAQLAAEQGAALKAKAEKEGDAVYLFTKKSRKK